MFKSIKAISASIILTLLVLSCGKETQSSTQGGGLFKYRVTFNPSIPNIPTLASRVNQVVISSTVPELGIFNWNTSSSNPKPEPLTNYESPEISVTKGQNIGITGVAIANLGSLGCVATKIEGIQNGKIIKTVNLELGYNSSTQQCKDVSNSSVNFIIE